MLSVEIPNLQVDVPDSPTCDTQGGPPEAELDTPKPAIARYETLNGQFCIFYCGPLHALENSRILLCQLRLIIHVPFFSSVE